MASWKTLMFWFAIHLNLYWEGKKKVDPAYWEGLKLGRYYCHKQQLHAILTVIKLSTQKGNLFLDS